MAVPAEWHCLPVPLSFYPEAIVPFCANCHDTDGAVSGLGVKPFSDEVLVPDVHTGHYGQTCTDCHARADGFNDHIVAHGGGAGGTSCSTCHGDLQAVHTSTPDNGWITVHADTDHDDAGWNGPKPYFDVYVDCVTCHVTDLRLIHGNDCSPCHPAPYNTLADNWQGGYQQGGCHQVYHEDSTMAHWPWENAYDEVNVDCDLCHNPGINAVVQQNCLHCHVASAANDTTPPTTSLRNQGSEPIGPAPVEFVGTAKVVFTIRDNGGKVGIGRTFYRIDGGPEIAAMDMLVGNDDPGTHVLEYWSKDQAGNTESPKAQPYTMIQDITPPTTTSYAKSSYSQYGKITFTATDAGTLGVKATYYRLDNGPIQVGTSFNVPVKSGAFTYTLDFWPEDWSGNIENQLKNRRTFTVTGGTGTLKLVWGNSDVNPGDQPTGGDWADWYIRKGSWNAPWLHRAPAPLRAGTGRDGTVSTTLPFRSALNRIM